MARFLVTVTCFAVASVIPAESLPPRKRGVGIQPLRLLEFIGTKQTIHSAHPVEDR